MAIELKSPWVIDLTTKFDKQLSQFGSSRERLLEFYKKFGMDGVIYDGTERCQSARSAIDNTSSRIIQRMLLSRKTVSFQNKFRYENQGFY